MSNYIVLEDFVPYENGLRMEIQKDDLNLMRDFFVLKSILAQEVMDFLEFDFDVKDVLCCISCI